MKSGRTPLTFSVIAMAPREAMLLKSFVRMLDSRTKQRWVYQAQESNHEQQAADLTFLGDEGEPQDANAVAPTQARQLRLGVLALDVYAKLDRPLRPDELERELNRLGKLLVTARMESASAINFGDYASTSHDENGVDAQPLYLWQLPQEGSTHSEFVPTSSVSKEFAGTVPARLEMSRSVAVSVPARAAVYPSEKTALPPQPAATRMVLPTDKLRLLRWPHATLLNTPAKLKLAAFMASSSSTLEKLQRTSGQTIQACTEFVNALHDSGFLSVKPAAMGVADSRVAGQPASAQTVSNGLLKQSESPKVLQATAGAGSLGLFARIRARLGMPLSG